jgi:hypothetical protein
MINAIKPLRTETVTKLVKEYATQLEVPAELHIDLVCKACCENPELAPDMNARRKSTNRLSAEQSIKQWVINFKHGYDERISVRHSKLPGTIPDCAISLIIETILPSNQNSHTHQLKIIHAHRLCMSAENILGLLLEEYLFTRLSNQGWAMAWGETIKHVDFCNEQGVLLQIKNRSNSENSSSKRVREGKAILKWFRIDAEKGKDNWQELVNIVGGNKANQLTENNFQAFIKDVLHNNPDAFAIEPGNPWLEDN